MSTGPPPPGVTAALDAAAEAESLFRMHSGERARRVVFALIDHVRTLAAEVERLYEVLVDHWNAGAGGEKTLAQYLEMTPEQYAAWMRDCRIPFREKGLEHGHRDEYRPLPPLRGRVPVRRRDP